jgi:FkbM family methyltransferase
MKFAIRKVLFFLGWSLVRLTQLKELWAAQDTQILISEQLERLRLFQETPLGSEMSILYLNNYKNIKSQLLQEVFVLSVLQGKRGGYFIEAGASDGIDCSNTYLLEKSFGWSGLLVEPSDTQFSQLSSNRNSTLTNAALWSESDLKLQFTETHSPGLSTITSLKDMDFLSKERTVFKEYEVKTISLTDLVKRNDAPHVIDYLSLDTEGSEYEILKYFDFSNYSFNVISVEHAWNELNRKLITTLLQNSGYIQIRAELTEYDSWYIERKLFKKLKERGMDCLVPLD